MASKQDETPDPAGVGHSFKVTHIMRPGTQLGGGAEVSTGHLNAHEAMDWIRAVVKDHQLGLRDKIHPAHGIHPELAAQLLTEADGGHIQPTLDAVADPAALEFGTVAGHLEEAAGKDAPAS